MAASRRQIRLNGRGMGVAYRAKTFMQAFSPIWLCPLTESVDSGAVSFSLARGLLPRSHLIECEIVCSALK